MNDLQFTAQGILIPNEILNRLPSSELTLTITRNYLLLHPKSMTQLTKGMLPQTKAQIDIDAEIYQMFEDRNR